MTGCHMYCEVVLGINGRQTLAHNLGIYSTYQVLIACSLGTLLWKGATGQRLSCSGATLRH